MLDRAERAEEERPGGGKKCSIGLASHWLGSGDAKDARGEGKGKGKGKGLRPRAGWVGDKEEEVR
jgi:hypothetical protein